MRSHSPEDWDGDDAPEDSEDPEDPEEIVVDITELEQYVNDLRARLHKSLSTISRHLKGCAAEIDKMADSI